MAVNTQSIFKMRGRNRSSIETNALALDALEQSRYEFSFS